MRRWRVQEKWMLGFSILTGTLLFGVLAFGPLVADPPRRPPVVFVPPAPLKPPPYPLTRKAAIGFLKQHGARVSGETPLPRDPGPFTSPLEITFDDRSPPFDDETLRVFAYIPDLQELTLKSQNLTGHGLRYLARLPHLKQLDVTSAALTSEGLKSLPLLRALETLNLNGPLSDDDLIPLIELPNLSDLSLSGWNRAKDDSRGITDRGLETLEELQNLESLGLSDLQVTDAGMRYVGSVTGLKFLYLSGLPITDAGLAPIGALAELRSLNLTRLRITNAGLKRLAGLPNIRSLTLSDTDVLDAGLVHLKTWEHLKSLDIDNVPYLSGAGLMHLRHLQTIERLDLRGPGITNAALREAAYFEDLVSISVGAGFRESSSPCVDDGGLVHLKNLKLLSYLALTGTRVTDAGLEQLRGLPHLNTVSIYKSRGVTAIGIQWLREAGLSVQTDVDR